MYPFSLCVNDNQSDIKLPMSSRLQIQQGSDHQKKITHKQCTLVVIKQERQRWQKFAKIKPKAQKDWKKLGQDALKDQMERCIDLWISSRRLLLSQINDKKTTSWL